jgi:hypothetical protein
VHAAIVAEGKLVAAEIREFKDGHGTDVRGRFQDWRLAWWRVYLRAPELDASSMREIARMAEAAERSGAIREAVSDAKVTVGRLAEAVR